jgi:hypothetical protein
MKIMQHARKLLGNKMPEWMRREDTGVLGETLDQPWMRYFCRLRHGMPLRGFGACMTPTEKEVRQQIAGTGGAGALIFRDKRTLLLPLRGSNGHNSNATPGPNPNLGITIF